MLTTQEPPENNGGAFDIALLTHENTVKPIGTQALSISESAKNERLFLLSKEATINIPPAKDGKTTSPKPSIKRTVNRKQITYKNTITFRDKTYKINNGKEGNPLGLYVEPLVRIIEQFEIGLTNWKRVFVLRFDLHQPFETLDNKLMTAFRKRLFQKLKRKYGFKEIGYCWAREYHGKGKGQHYHWAIWLDGDKIRHSSKINELIKASWEKPSGGYHVPTIKRPFYFVDGEEVAKEAIYRLSYLAKTRGKGHRSAQTKDYQCSRMKENPPALTESDLEPLKLEEQQIIPEIAGTSLKPPSAAFKRINHYNDRFKQNCLQGMTEHEIEEFCQLFEQCQHANKGQEVKEEISILFGFSQPLADINTFIINELGAQN